MLNLTENEEIFAEEYCKYYNEYDGDIPDSCWKKIGLFRKKLGISIGRGAEITNDIDANGYDNLVKVGDSDEKDEAWEQIKESLCSDEYDNETYQTLVDEWMDYYAETDEEKLLCYYYKALSWEKEYDMQFDYRRENSGDLSEEEKEKLDQSIEQANSKTLSNVKMAIACLDEDTVSYWLCTLNTIKARCLHNMGEHLEAVHAAIVGLEYACDEEEKKAAQWQISGKHGQGLDSPIPYCGYGIEGRTQEELISSVIKTSSFTPDKDSSFEDNIETLELFAEFFPIEIEEIRNGGVRTLSSLPYHDRQFIFTVRDLDHIGGCYDESGTIQYVFAMNELPKNISFPLGHPQPNTLYYAHPLRSVYLPFETAQTLLFHERIQEMCRLFQCLGATRITARCIKGEKISESVMTSYNLDANIGSKVVDSSFAKSRSDSHKSNRNNKNELFLEQDFSPKKYPYCPNDLVWAMNDPEIQTLIQQRLEGSLISFNKRVSSFETSNLSQNRIQEVRGAFNALIMNLSANFSSCSEQLFNSIEETEWELSVQFKPIEEFEVTSNSPDKIQLPRKENLLMEVENYVPLGNDGSLGLGIVGTLHKDVKLGDKVIIGDKRFAFRSVVNNIVIFFKNLEQGEAGDEHVILILEDVTPTNIERGMSIYLDTDRASLVDETTSQLPPQNSAAMGTTDTELTDEEQKYKEEVLFCLEEGGTISLDDRKYLERKRIKFKISEERAQEIEKQCTPMLTDNEKEYIETFKDLCKDGAISDRARRLLDRERQALGISKERANEIEEMI